MIENQHPRMLNSDLETPGGPCSPYGCSWVAGMMYVNSEDLDEVARHREVECESCERVYDPSRALEPGYLVAEAAETSGYLTTEALDTVAALLRVEAESDHGWTGVAGLPWGGTG
jgi:hypothetical protein